MKKNELKIPKYNIGDEVLVKGSELQLERVLTVHSIRVHIKAGYNKGDTDQDIWYVFKESKLMYLESEIQRRIKL